MEAKEARGICGGCADSGGAATRATVSFVIACSFFDWLLRGKIMFVGGSMCTEYRDRLCKLYCFQTVANWFGGEREKKYPRPRVEHFAVSNVQLAGSKVGRVPAVQRPRLLPSVAMATR